MNETELEQLQDERDELESKVKALELEISGLNQTIKLLMARIKDIQDSYDSLNQHYVSIRSNPCIKHHLLRYEFTLHPALFFSITQEAQRQLIMDVLHRAMREMQEALLPSKF